MILNAILKLVWIIFVQGPLNLIAAFNKVLEYLTGGLITDILFGSSREFKWNNIPVQFWWFVIVAFCVFSLIFTIQMIILIFKEAAETKTKFVLATQNAVKAFAFMFLIPIFFFLANFIIQSLANTIINNFGNNSNIAQYLYHIGDPNWDGAPTPPSDKFGPPDDLRGYNMIAQIFGTWFMLFSVFIIGITLIQKIIELFFLFIISPIVMIVMVIDNGKSAFIWKDMVIAKFLASSGTLIGYYVFISVTQILLSSGLNGLEATEFVRSLFIVLYLCGGALATMAFSDIIAHFVGESAGIREGMSSMRSTMAGGMMAIGSAKMTGRAIGFAQSKRAGRNLNSGDSGGIASALSGAAASSESKLAFASYYNATSGLSSRAGILGLAGLAIGATAVGIARFNEGKAEAGVKGGVKKVGRGLKEVAISPFNKVKRTFHPNIFKSKKKQDKSDRINSERVEEE